VSSAKRSTSESNFRGDSPGKKQARVLFWDLVKDRLGPKDFVKGPYLVISGPQGGDISTLLAMGVEPSAIYAVDIAKHDLAAAKARFGEAGVHFAQVEFKGAHRHFGIAQFACAFIDMCAPIRKEDLNALLELPARFRGYEFLLGREQGLVSTFIRSVTKPGQHITEPRLRYLGSHGFETNGCIYYSSGSESTIGMTMCVALCAKLLKRGAKEYDIIEVHFTQKDLRKALTKNRSKAAAGLYNMRPGTVAAWRAWESRK
jgi:hypothetical protein